MGDIENAAATLLKSWTFTKGQVPKGGAFGLASEGTLEDTVRFAVEVEEAEKEKKEGSGGMELTEGGIEELDHEELLSALMFASESGNKFLGESKQGSEGEGASEGEKESMKKEGKQSMKNDPCAAKLKDKDDQIERLKKMVLTASQEIASTKDSLERMTESNIKNQTDLENLKAEQERVVPEGVTLEDYLDHLEGRIRAYEEVVSCNTSTHYPSGRCRLCDLPAKSLWDDHRFDPKAHTAQCAVIQARKTIS